MGRRKVRAMAVVLTASVAGIGAYLVSTSVSAGQSGANSNGPDSSRAAMLQRFKALRSAPPTDVPQQLRNFASDPDMNSRFGTDGSGVREVTSPAGQRWFLVPGDRGLCFYDGHGGACTSNEDALTGRLFAILLAAPSLPGGIPVGDSNALIRGVVPDGVTKVTAVGASGAQQSATIGEGAYELRVTNPRRLEFEGPAAPPPVVIQGDS
jgi:hypothetical protein